PVQPGELPTLVVDPDAHVAVLDCLEEFGPVWLAEDRRIVRQRDLVQTALRQASDIVSHHLRCACEDRFLATQRQVCLLGATTEATVHVAAPADAQPLTTQASEIARL